MGANDAAWEKVIAAYTKELEEHGQFFIDSTRLKELSNREPRLLAKHDFSHSRPAIFQKLGLNIMPVSRSRYLVGHFEMFAPFPPIAGPLRQAEVPAGIESLGTITSESLALAAAGLSGMLEDFLGCSRLLPTVSGRMSTGTFVMGGITVDRAQMEIDGGYESTEYLVLVEAKNHLSADFNVRQLYFPYRRFQAQVSKEVVPVYLVYTNGVFSLYRFTFGQDMMSIQLADAARYSLSPSRLDAGTLLTALEATHVEAEPAVPFPQANSFARVLNIVELLHEAPANREEISDHYDFDPRQADYYANAGRYLGLVRSNQGRWEVTERAEALLQAERDNRTLGLVRLMGQHAIFRAVLQRCLQEGVVPGKEDIGKQMAALGLGESTVRRRASTVQGWAQWVLDQLGEPTLF